MIQVIIISERITLCACRLEYVLCVMDKADSRMVMAYALSLTRTLLVYYVLQYVSITAFLLKK